MGHRLKKIIQFFFRLDLAKIRVRAMDFSSRNAPSS